MTKEELLLQLRYQTYVMLKTSPLHGIGVFAIREIPKGCRDIFSRNVGEWIKLPVSDVETLPSHAKELVETYCLYDKENYYVPDYGFKVMDLVNYLNHSHSPNIKSIQDGEEFEALRDIRLGEELFINYEHIVDGVEGY